MRKNKKIKKYCGLQEKINSLLEEKIDEISRQMQEDLSAKDIDVLIKLANLREKVGGRPILAASVAVIEELLNFLEEKEKDLKIRLEGHLSEFFARMRDNYE